MPVRCKFFKHDDHLAGRRVPSIKLARFNPAARPWTGKEVDVIHIANDPVNPRPM